MCFLRGCMMVCVGLSLRACIRNSTQEHVLCVQTGTCACTCVHHSIGMPHHGSKQFPSWILAWHPLTFHAHTAHHIPNSRCDPCDHQCEPIPSPRLPYYSAEAAEIRCAKEHLEQVIGCDVVGLLGHSKGATDALLYASKHHDIPKWEPDLI